MQFTEKETTENYSQDRVLGFGGFGIVYKGLINGSFVVIKKLNEVVGYLGHCNSVI